MRQGALPPATRAFRLATAGEAARAVQAAARLGVPDLLANGPMPVDAIATVLGCHLPSLRRLLRALTAAGVFARVSPDTFGPNDVSEALREGVPGSVRPAALAGPLAPLDAYWGDITESVRAGCPSFELSHGQPFFAYLAKHPEQAERFDAGMTRASRGHAEAILRAWDFSGHAHVVDVGGGRGAFLAALLSTYPVMRGTLVDLPHTAVDPAPLREAGVLDRCTVVGGDFRRGVPAGGDAYLLKAVLHDWPDGEAVDILARCRQALRPSPSSRVIVVEMLVPPRGGMHPALFVDLDLMVLTGGRERTRAEFAHLFRAAGLRLERVVSMGTPFSVLVGACRKR